MAGKLVVSTLNNDTGVLATQNGMTGICKAWINFNSGNGTINNSFNVSSVTYSGQVGVGYLTTINFTTAMPNTSYIWVSSCRDMRDNTTAYPNNTPMPQLSDSKTTTSFQIRQFSTVYANQSSSESCVAFFA